MNAKEKVQQEHLTIMLKVTELITHQQTNQGGSKDDKGIRKNT